MTIVEHVNQIQENQVTTPFHFMTNTMLLLAWLLFIKQAAIIYPATINEQVGLHFCLIFDINLIVNFTGDLFTKAAEMATAAMKGRLANKYYGAAEEAYGMEPEEETETNWNNISC